MIYGHIVPVPLYQIPYFNQKRLLLFLSSPLDAADITNQKFTSKLCVLSVFLFEEM